MEFVTRKEYLILETKFRELEARYNSLEERFLVLCQALDVNTESPRRELIPKLSKEMELFPTTPIEPQNEEKKTLSEPLISFLPQTAPMNVSPPRLIQTQLVKLNQTAPANPFGPITQINPSSNQGNTPSLPVQRDNISPGRAFKGFIVPFPKVNLKSLNNESLHVITDYGAEIVLLHGYEACIKLKDQYLKPIGFRFSSELPFGAGWTGTKGHYLKLREEMRKRNVTIPVEEFLMDQIMK
jgi:hypothetical protein